MKNIMKEVILRPDRKKVLDMIKQCKPDNFERRSKDTLDRILQKVVVYAPEYIPYLYKRSEKIRNEFENFSNFLDAYVITWALRLSKIIPSDSVHTTTKIAITQKFPEPYIIKSEILLSFNEKVKKYKSKKLRYVAAIAEVMFKLKEYEYTNSWGKHYEIPKTYILNKNPNITYIFILNNCEKVVIFSGKETTYNDNLQNMKHGQVSPEILAYALKQGVIKENIIKSDFTLSKVYAIAGLQERGIKNSKVRRFFSPEKFKYLEKLRNGKVIS